MSSAKKNDASNSAGSTAASTSLGRGQEADLFRLLVLELHHPITEQLQQMGVATSQGQQRFQCRRLITQGEMGSGSLDQLPRFILTEAAQFDDTCVDEIARPGGRFFKRV